MRFYYLMSKADLLHAVSVLKTSVFEAGRTRRYDLMLALQ